MSDKPKAGTTTSAERMRRKRQRDARDRGADRQVTVSGINAEAWERLRRLAAAMKLSVGQVLTSAIESHVKSAQLNMNEEQMLVFCGAKPLSNMEKHHAAKVAYDSSSDGLRVAAERMDRLASDGVSLIRRMESAGSRFTKEEIDEVKARNKYLTHSAKINRTLADAKDQQARKGKM